MSLLSAFPAERTDVCDRVLRKYAAFSGAFALGSRALAQSLTDDPALADRVATIPVYAGITGFLHDAVVDGDARSDGTALSHATRNQLVTIGDHAQRTLFETVLDLQERHDYDGRAVLDALDAVSRVQFDESRSVDPADPVAHERERVDAEARAWATMLVRPVAAAVDADALPVVARYHRLLVSLMRFQILSDAVSDLPEDAGNGVKTLPLALLERDDGVRVAEVTPDALPAAFADSAAERAVEERIAAAVGDTLALLDAALSRGEPFGERAVSAWNRSTEWYLDAFPGREELRLSGREAVGLLSAYADGQGAGLSVSPDAVFRRPDAVTLRLPRTLLRLKRLRDPAREVA